MRLAKFALMVVAMILWAHTVSAEIVTWRVGDDTRSAIVHPPGAEFGGWESRADFLLPWARRQHAELSAHGHAPRVAGGHRRLLPRSAEPSRRSVGLAGRKGAGR
jgi:hypothetical protein